MTFQSFSLNTDHNATKTKRKHLFEGHSKILLDDPVEDVIVLQFKDSLPILEKKDDNTAHIDIPGKASINNRLSEMFFLRLSSRGIPNHFISRISMTEQRVRACEPLPFKVVIHNIATPDFAYRLNIQDGMILPEPIIEFVHPLEDGHYSIIHDKHIDVFQMASPQEMEHIVSLTHRVNDFLSGLFLAVGLQLMCFRLDFGRFYTTDFFMESELLLIDELTPDRMNILDLESNQRLDRAAALTMENPSYAYQLIAEKFGLLNDGGPIDIRQIKQVLSVNDGFQQSQKL